MKISKLRRTLAVFLSAMLVLLCMPMMAITASAADYSYDASENYVTYNSDGLTVRFTMTDCGLNMHYWTVFLFDPAVFSSVTYDSTHKLTDSGSMGLESAAYAFATNNTSDAVNVLQIATAAMSSEDLKGSGKCLSDIWSTKDWVVVLGPYHNWGGKNYYNCDYYIGNANNIPASAPSPKYTITFDPNGGELPSGVASTAQTTDGKLTSAQLAVTPTYEGFTFKGWFTAATDGTPVTTDTTFSGNDTIYAQWEAVSTGGDVAAYSTAYAYDCSRKPDFPTKGSDVTLRGFSAPLIDTNRNKKGTTSGDWKLIKKGAYSDSYEEGHSSTLISLLETTASNFGTEYTNIDVYELRDGDTHICYGVLSAFMSKGYFFIGTTWGNGGAGYFLSDEVCSGPMTETVTGDPTSPPEPEPEPEPEPDPSEYDVTTDEIKDAGYMDLEPGTRIYVNTDTFKTGRKMFYVDTYESAASIGYITDNDIDSNYLYYYQEALTYGSIITLKSKYQANHDGDGDILCGGTWRCTVDFENDGVLEIYSTTPTEDCPDPDNPTPDPGAPEGYTTDANKIMAYRYNSNGCFDIQGKFNGNWRPTTYGNDGYETKVKVGDDVYDVSAAPFASAETLGNGLKVGIDMDFVNDGKQLKVVYTVENTGAEAINYALASGADVQIGGDDTAVITPFSDAKGFKMVSKGVYYDSDDDEYYDCPLDHYTKPDGTKDYAQFNFFGDSKYSGVTGVSALWYGGYGDYSSNKNDTLFIYGSNECETAADGEYLDSAMTWRWDNNTIDAGDTQTFSVLIGIGGAGSENVVPSDPSEPTHTHKFGEWTIVKEATTTEEGLLERVCECGEKETKVIDKLVDTDKDNDNGNVVDITPDDNAGGAALDDIEDVAENIPLEPEEYIAIQEGEDLKIYLEVVDVTDASETMPEADKALINEKINSVNNMKQGMLIDVSLFKKVGGSEPTKVTNTKAPIRIAFEMPESLINKNSNVVRKYYIIRVHEGVADTLDGIFDTASKKFTFETDRFSSYAIAYTDYAIGSPSIPSAPGSSESSSNKHTHNYVWKNDSTSHWQMCNCGGVNDKGAHTFGDWEIVKEPTETEDGIKKHTCTVCGYSETNTIEDVSSGAGDVVANDILEVTEKDITLAITFIISATVIGMTIAKRRRVSK